MYNKFVRLHVFLLSSSLFSLITSARDPTNNTLTRRVNVQYVFDSGCSSQQRDIINSIVNLEMIGMLTIASNALKTSSLDNALGSYNYAKYADYFGQRFVPQRRRFIRNHFTKLLDHRRLSAIVPRTHFRCGGEELPEICAEDPQGFADVFRPRPKIGYAFPGLDIFAVENQDQYMAFIGLCPEFWRLPRWEKRHPAYDDQISSLLHLFLWFGGTIPVGDEVHNFYQGDNAYAAGADWPADRAVGLARQTMFAKALVLKWPERGKYEFRWDRGRHIQVVYQPQVSRQPF